MTITNGSFDEAGATPGSAAGWTSAFVGTAEEFADFAQNPSSAGPFARESFEAGWTGGTDQVFVAALGGETEGTVAAIFNVGPGQAQEERFEYGWAVSDGPPIFMHELSALAVATFGTFDHEPFSLGWATWNVPAPAPTANPFLATLPTPTAALFDGGTVAFESFDAWKPALITSFTPGDLEELAAETFENASPTQTFTVNASSNTGTLDAPPPFPLVDDEKITLSTTGTLPTPLATGTTYHVDLHTPPLTFGFANVSGGAIIFIDDVGNGVHSLTRDPAAWWSRFMTTV